MLFFNEVSLLSFSLSEGRCPSFLPPGPQGRRSVYLLPTMFLRLLRPGVASGCPAGAVYGGLRHFSLFLASVLRSGGNLLSVWQLP